MLGQKINENDWISYPGRSGSCQWINISKVVSIETKTERYGDNVRHVDFLKVVSAKTRFSGRTATVRCLDRVIKLGPIAVASAIKNNIIRLEE